MAKIVLPKELKLGCSITFYTNDGEEHHGHISSCCPIIILNKSHTIENINKIFNDFGFTREEIQSRFGTDSFGIWPYASTYEDLYELLNEMESRSLSVSPYVEYTDLSEGSNIKFHLPDEVYVGIIKRITENKYYVCILLNHCTSIVNKIFDAFKVSRTAINGVDHTAYTWPESSLEDLQKFIKSLPIKNNSKKQTNHVFELQNTGIDFKREENKGGNPVCSRIREAAISIKCLSNSKISC